MTRLPPPCEREVRIIVVYAWPGELAIPSVFYLCEACADHMCTRIEDGTWPGAESIAYLVLVTPEEADPHGCDIYRRGW